MRVRVAPDGDARRGGGAGAAPRPVWGRAGAHRRLLCVAAAERPGGGAGAAVVGGGRGVGGGGGEDAARVALGEVGFPWRGGHHGAGP